jgi:phage I-like protein
MGNVKDHQTIRLDEGETTPTLGRWIDLETVELDETGDTASSWIQIFPYRSYTHPIHGKLSFTPERAQRFAANIKANVRGQDLDIDYDHKEKSGEAAGWLKDAEARSDGLWGLVEWTKDAATKIKNKAYRYFSPEYVDKWKHPETGQLHEDVLFGGALTNRPFLKGILPINLSEMTGDDNQPQGGNQVNRELLEKLAKRLGVEFSADTSDEDLQSAVSAAAEKEPEPTSEDDTKEPVLATEQEDELTKLAETNPAVALMLQERKETADRLARLETANRLSEVSIQLSELDDIEGGNFRLTPALKQDLSKLAIKLSDNGQKALFDFVKRLLKDGVVELGERGGRPNGGGATFADPTDEFENRVKKLMSENADLSYADAVEDVSRQDPDLFEAYREEATSFVERD